METAQRLAMYFDLLDWDDDDDPNGNVVHIEAAGLTPEEVANVMAAHPGGPDDYSESSGFPMIFGTTPTGKRIVVIYEDESDAGFIVLRPVTAYPVPEYGG